jgi:hypothetical protein
MFLVFEKLYSDKELRQRSDWATGWTIRSSIPRTGKTVFSSRNVLNGSVVTLASYSMGTGGPFRVGKWLKWPGPDADNDLSLLPSEVIINYHKVKSGLNLLMTSKLIQ